MRKQKKAVNSLSTKKEAVVESLYMSDNGKTKFRSNHRNTFGLMYGLPKNGGTCPGATTGEGGCLYVKAGHKRATCYMEKVVQIYKAVGAKLVENTNLLKDKSIDEMAEVLRATVQKFKDANTEENWYMRLHYSGDFFSEDYAKAWAKVLKEFPEVRFWVYTRSHNVVKHLVDCTNLTIMLSVDSVNYKSGLKVHNQYKDKPNVGLAWLGIDSPEGERWVTCPETSGILANKKDEGACAKCRLCIDNYKSKVRNIKFVIH